MRLDLEAMLCLPGTSMVHEVDDGGHTVTLTITGARVVGLHDRYPNDFVAREFAVEVEWGDPPHVGTALASLRARGCSPPGASSLPRFISPPGSRYRMRVTVPLGTLIEHGRATDLGDTVRLVLDVDPETGEARVVEFHRCILPPYEPVLTLAGSRVQRNGETKVIDRRTNEGRTPWEAFFPEDQENPEVAFP